MERKKTKASKPAHGIRVFFPQALGALQAKLGLGDVIQSEIRMSVACMPSIAPPIPVEA